MRLPDFDIDADLNALRAAMGASLREYSAAPSADVLTIEEIERLAGEGIEIPVDEVRVLNDGTHVYKGKRVVVYIRDIAEYGARTAALPRYHLAMCDTLHKMMEAGRYKKRYVVAARDDGKFSIQRIRGEAVAKSDEVLDVCQNCLEELKYRSFSRQLASSDRTEAVRKFSLKGFFDEFGRSCVWAVPKFDAVHAPTNIYSHQFYWTARNLKEKRGFRCERIDCRRDLSDPVNRKYLHAHHIDAENPTIIRPTSSCSASGATPWNSSILTCASIRTTCASATSFPDAIEPAAFSPTPTAVQLPSRAPRCRSMSLALPSPPSR